MSKALQRSDSKQILEKRKSFSVVLAEVMTEWAEHYRQPTTAEMISVYESGLQGEITAEGLRRVAPEVLKHCDNFPRVSQILSRKETARAKNGYYQPPSLEPKCFLCNDTGWVGKKLVRRCDHGGGK